MTVNWVVVGGIAACFAAIVAAVLAVLGLGPPRIALDRRSRPGTALAASGRWTGQTQRLILAADNRLASTGKAARLSTALEGAGSPRSAGEYLLLIAAITLGLTLVGTVVGGFVLGAVFAVVTPLLSKMLLGMRVNRRRAQFADQLDDTLQLLAGSLRAGHSLLRAIDAVSREAEQPTSAEFSRVMNESRVGRDLAASLENTAARMASKDFTWIAQAIAIHREVGGDLGEVLDTVSHTIRERNQIRRQVKALSAEGRMSGMVLMALPFVVAGFLWMSNPGYLLKLTESPLGWAIAGSGVVMLTIGGLWLRKVVSFTF